MDSTYVRKTYGITGAFTEVFNAIGAIAGSVNNVASGCEEVTASLPELGHDTGKLMASRAKLNLANQLKLQESA